MTKISERLNMEKVAEIMEMKQDIVSTLNNVETIMEKEKAFYAEAFKIEIIDSLITKANEIITKAETKRKERKTEIAKNIKKVKAAKEIARKNKKTLSKAAKGIVTPKQVVVPKELRLEAGAVIYEIAIALNKENKGGIVMNNLQLLADKAEKADINVISPLCSEARMRALNKKLIKGLYETGFVVDRINMSINKNCEIENQRFCRSLEGTVQMFKYYKVDTVNTSYTVESYDGNGNLKDVTIRKTGIKNASICSAPVDAYAEYDANNKKIDWESHKKLSEDVIIFQFKAAGMGRKAQKAAERMASIYAINGMFVGEDKDGNKIAYETKQELIDSGNRIIGAYRAQFCSPSTLKHGVIFFSKMNCTIDEYNDALNGIFSDNFINARDERIDQVDDITQGALMYAINELENDRLSSIEGNEAIKPNKYSKIFVRPGLIAATPLLPFGNVRNIFMINTNIETEDEFKNESDEIKSIMKDMGIDNNFSDGGFYTSLKQVRRGVDFIGGINATDEQLMSLGLQERSDLITAKGFSRIADENMMLERGLVLLKLYANSIIVYCEQSDTYVSKGIKRKYTGKELVKMLENDKTKALAEFIIKGSDIMATKNEMKLVNWDAIEEKTAAATLYLVDAQNASLSETSNQMLNKVLDTHEDEIKETIHAMADEDAFDLIDLENIKPIRFNKDCTAIGSRPIDASMNLIHEDALKDAGLMTSFYSNETKAATAKIARARVNTKSPYLVATPDDYILGSYFDENGKYVPLNILGARVVTDYSPTQIANKEEGSKEITCIEVYSAKVNKTIAEDIESLRKDSNYSKEDLAKIEESLRINTMLKYPTQGRDEYVFVYFVSNREILERINKAEDDNKITASRAKALKNFYFKCPLSCIIIAADNSLKNQLAGFDFDGDTVIIVPREIVEGPDGDLIYGIYDYENDKVLNDYTSILIKKYIEKGRRYICTCIVYEDEEIKYGKKPTYRNINKNNKNSKYRSANRRASYVETNNAIEEVQNAFGGLTFGYDAIDFLNKPIVENYVPIEDIMGLYHACNTVGDDIGMTIVLCSVIIMASIEKEIFRDGKFDYELFQDLFEPLHPGKVDEGYNNKPFLRYTSVFNEEPDENGNVSKVIATNRFGVTREYYKVSKSTIIKFCYRIKHLREETNIAEWKLLVNDFNHITRALGESSIDKKKDVTKDLGKTVFDIVATYVRCLGNIKNKHILSNFTDIYTEEGRSNPFAFDFITAFVDAGQYMVLADGVGDIKFDMSKVYAKAMNIVRRDIVKNTSYSFYEKYNTGLRNDFSNTDDVNHAYISYIGKSVRPQNGIPKLSKYEKEVMLNGIFNLAKLDGMDIDNDPKSLVRLAIEDAFYNAYDDEYNFAVNYNSRLNTVMNTYNELFIMERTGLDNIPVELQLTLDCKNYLDDSDEGCHFSFTDGICDTDPALELVDDFTGSAKCVDGKLIVYYNPVHRILANDKILTLTVNSFAKSKGLKPSNKGFASTGKDIDEGNSWGFNVVNNRMADLRFGKTIIVDNYGDAYTVLTIVDTDDNVVAVMNQELDTDELKALEGKAFSGCMLVGYTYDATEGKKTSRAKKVVRKFRYMLNGIVSF